MALVLFDIDGTLLRGGDPTHAKAFDAACRKFFDVPGDTSRSELAGRTDRYILLTLLSQQEVRPTEAEIADVFRFMEDYVERELTHSLAERVLPGVAELLRELRERRHLIGLVTGNLPRIAKTKLSRAGLWAAFDPIGGFGDLSPTRSDLVKAALERADFPAHRTVVIGDTIHDIECGRTHGTRTIGVATGHTPAASLTEAGAHLAVPSLADTGRILRYIAEMS